MMEITIDFTALHLELDKLIPELKAAQAKLGPGSAVDDILDLATKLKKRADCQQTMVLSI